MKAYSAIEWKKLAKLTRLINSYRVFILTKVKAKVRVKGIFCVLWFAFSIALLSSTLGSVHHFACFWLGMGDVYWGFTAKRFFPPELLTPLLWYTWAQIHDLGLLLPLLLLFILLLLVLLLPLPLLLPLLHFYSTRYKLWGHHSMALQIHPQKDLVI